VPAVGAPANRSGAIIAGGTAQNAAALNANRRAIIFQNLDGTAQMWVSVLAAAVADQPSLLVGPGETLVLDQGLQGTGALSVISATTGAKYACWEA
jgi:hypothetical protein